jgi:hypothetical protein
MTMMNFPLTIADPIDELAAARSLLRERRAGKPQPGIRDSGCGFRPDPQPRIPGFAAPYSVGARPKGMGARYSQSAVALLL